jgi:hypothetical protein
MFLRVPLCHVTSSEQGLLGCHFNQLKTEGSIYIYI